MRKTIDMGSIPNFSIPSESCDPETGLTLVNADDPTVQLNDLYPTLSTYSPGTRGARHPSISEGHPLRASSVDSVRFAPCLPKKLVQRIERIFPTVQVYPLSYRECQGSCLPKKLVQRIERIFPTVQVYPLSYRECQGLPSPGPEFSTDTAPSLFFPGADERKALDRLTIHGSRDGKDIKKLGTVPGDVDR